MLDVKVIKHLITSAKSLSKKVNQLVNISVSSDIEYVYLLIMEILVYNTVYGSEILLL